MIEEWARRSALVIVETRRLRDVRYGCQAQLTLIALDGVRAFVREARRASGMEHFCINSGARLGHRARADVIGAEVLLVAAPRAHEAIAAAVAELDELRRPVLRSPSWSFKAARAAWEAARPLGGGHRDRVSSHEQDGEGDPDGV